MQLKLLGLFLLLFNPLLKIGQDSEYAVKVAFMERFTRFIEWPAEIEINDRSKAFVFGVLGENPFDYLLEDFFEKQRIKKSEVELRYLDSYVEASDCHMLYISKSESGNLQTILHHLKEKPILTISDSDGFAEAGVMINLFVEDEYIRFEINEKAAQAAGLSISYHLLNNARNVY